MYRETNGEPLFGGESVFQYGKMDVVREGQDGSIITYGGMVHRAVKIAEEMEKKGISIGVINMPCVREMDEGVLDALVKLPFIFTYEDHNIHTGIAPFMAGHLLKWKYKGRLESFGVKDYGASGDTDEVLAVEGLDVESMVKALSGMVKRKRRR